MIAMNIIMVPPFFITRADALKKSSIDFDHSSNSMSSHPAEPKKLSLIFLRFVSLFFIKLPRLYGGSVTIRSIDSAPICCIAAMQSWLYNVVSAILNSPFHRRFYFVALFPLFTHASSSERLNFHKRPIWCAGRSVFCLIHFRRVTGLMFKYSAASSRLI